PTSRKPTGITVILITDTGLMGASLRLACASDDEPAACGLLGKSALVERGSVSSTQGSSTA
ncbi:MAG: hypothetical protein ACO2Z6_11865, partial [Pseudohongiellaceae bacterium]